MWDVYRRHMYSTNMSAELVGRYKYKWLAFLIAYKHSTQFYTTTIKHKQDEY